MERTMQKECDVAYLILYINNDLDQKKRETVERHILTCTSCSSALDELKKERSFVAGNTPFDTFKKNKSVFRELESIVHSGNSSDALRSQRYALFDNDRHNGMPVTTKRGIPVKSMLDFRFRSAYAVAAVLVLFVVATPFLLSYLNKSKQVTFKGSDTAEPDLFIYVKQEDGTHIRRAEQVYYPGESIQFAYSSKEQNYLALLSINDQGYIQILFPQNSDSSSAIRKNDVYSLPYAIKLDSYTGDELYIAFFSYEKMSIDELHGVTSQRFLKNKSVKALELDSTEKFKVKKILTMKKDDSGY